MAIKAINVPDTVNNYQTVTPTPNQIQGIKAISLDGSSSGFGGKSISKQDALRYAMKMGMTDSSRGLQQVYAKLTKKSSLLDTLKQKDEKLRAIFENPEYGDKAFQSYLGSAIALDPVGWIPLAGWMKKSKSLADATKYGAGLGGAYGATSYVGEGESRLLNAAAGATGGGVLGLGGAAVARSITKALGKEPIIPSSSDIQKRNIEDRALLTQEGKALTPEEIDEVVSKAVTDQQAQKPDVMGESVKTFYTNVAGDKLWDVAVQNWGSGIVGVAAGVGGYNAFNDPESTEAQKIIAGVLFSLGGVGATKALSKISFNSGTLGDIMSRGIVDNYGLPQRYTDVVKASTGEVNKLATQFAEIVEETQTLTMEQRKLLNGMITGEIDEIPELGGFSVKARNVIKKAGQEMVDAGLLSQEVFNKNIDTYLKRTYEKYLNKQISKEGYQAARQLKLIGDELRARGSKNTKKLTIAAYNRSLKPTSKTFNDYAEYTPVPLTSIVSKVRYEKIQNKISKQKRENINNYKVTEEVKDIRDWKVVDDDGTSLKLESTKEINLRRDYTKAERVAMGEIEDASFNIAETGRLMTNDLTTFKIYENIAKDDTLSLSKLAFDDKISKGLIQVDDWVQVPSDVLNQTLKVKGKPIKKYGQLSGQYVPKEIFNDLTRIQNLKQNSDGVLNGYLAVNRLWKKTKTAWNPVVHVNNTVSNIILYDLADANYKFMGRGFSELQKGLRKDKDATFFKLADEYGVFNSDMLTQELRKQSSEIGDDILRKLSDETAPEIINAQQYSLGVLQKLGRKTKNLTVDKLERFYQLEDQAFRMGLFMDRLAKGMSPAEAAADAKKWFIDYDINAPFINAARRFPTPFLSYTYRVVPLLAEAAVRRPWKFAKWSLGAHLLNEAGNTFGPGNEQEERALMREEMQQKLFGMPFLPSTTVKLPFASERKSSTGEAVPLYIDLKRFIPGGDVFTVGEKGIGIPIPLTDNRSIKLPTTLTPSFGALGEIMIPIMTGVDPFTLQKIEGLGLGNDDAVKLQHIASRLTPNIPSTAFSVPLFKAFQKPGAEPIDVTRYDPFGETFGSKKIVQAFRRAKEGTETQYGTNYTPFEAIMSVFGFKLQPTEISKLLGIKGAEFRRFYATTKKSVRKISRDLSQGTISQEKAEEELDELYRNLEREALRFQDIAQARQQNVRGGYIVPQVKDDPKTRINPLTGEPYEEEEETRTPRQGFIVGGMAQSEVTGTTPLENELYALQQQSEVGLPQEDEYGGIEKKERGVKRLGFVEGGDERYQAYLALLKQREGVKLNEQGQHIVYQNRMDKPGVLTAGHGHKLVEKELAQYREGDVVPEQLVNQWFVNDTRKAYQAAQKQIKDLNIEDKNFLPVLGSVNYQLGTNWTQKFPLAYKALQERNYKEAARQVQLNSAGDGDSKWMRQSPARVKDFVVALSSLN